MNTNFINSTDGTRVAYDRCGAGPAIVLLHGGGSTRQEWHEAGYVKRLRDTFTVITVDLRGHGESGHPTDPADYTPEKMVQDILAVVNSCRIERFIVWGMSYGGKVGRYLTFYKRLTKLILMGTPLGLGVSGERRQEALDFYEHWSPIAKAQCDGTLDHDTLSQDDQEFLSCFNIPVMMAWVRAMLDWPAVEPADFHCPTLWLIGSKDRHAMTSYKEREESIKGSRVQVHKIEGLDHEQVFSEIDLVFPTLLAFSQA